jgi:hypothetical protein
LEKVEERIRLFSEKFQVLLLNLMTEEEEEEEEEEDEDWLSSEERTMTLPGLSEPPSLSL